MKKEETKTESGLVLGLSIIAFELCAYGLALAMQLNQQIFTARASHAVAGLGLQVLGITFVASYYYEHKSFLFRGLMWFCENFPLWIAQIALCAIPSCKSPRDGRWAASLLPPS
jgi:hypothetical protein